jgi:hypothetical protein
MNRFKVQNSSISYISAYATSSIVVVFVFLGKRLGYKWLDYECRKADEWKVGITKYNSQLSQPYSSEYQETPILPPFRFPDFSLY